MGKRLEYCTGRETSLVPPQSSSDRQRGHRWRHALPPVRYCIMDLGRVRRPAAKMGHTFVILVIFFFTQSIGLTMGQVTVCTSNNDFMEK
jgi:hypothetical protein